MRRAFADTHFWIALVDEHDEWHVPARLAKHKLGEVQLVTTDEILTEVLNGFSGHGEHLRGLATGLVFHLRRDRTVSIVPQSRASFDRGLVLYDARRDKGYSLVDCISMTAMRRLGLRDVLTNDRHFTQEGFNVLLH
jgi:predicted nucleic acid-binding protein